MINVDKCNVSWTVVHDLSTKLRVSSETKDVYVKVLNMITRINEAKTLRKLLLCDCKFKFNCKTCNSN